MIPTLTGTLIEEPCFEADYMSDEDSSLLIVTFHDHLLLISFDFICRFGSTKTLQFFDYLIQVFDYSYWGSPK